MADPQRKLTEAEEDVLSFVNEGGFTIGDGKQTPGTWDNFGKGALDSVTQGLYSMQRGAAVAKSAIAIGVLNLQYGKSVWDKPGDAARRGEMTEAHRRAVYKGGTAQATANVEHFRPDASQIGVAGNTLNSVISGLVPFVTGPIGGALSTGANTAGDVIDKGGTLGQAWKAGGAATVGAYVGAKLPASVGKTIPTKVVTGAVGNIAAGVATNLAIGATVDGNKELEDMFAVTPQSLAVDGLMGAVFGGVDGMLGRPATPSEKAAAATINNAAVFEGRTPGKPNGPKGVKQHTDALTKALKDLAAGKIPNVSGLVDLRNFGKANRAVVMREPKTEIARSIAKHAEALGVDPLDLATVIGFETGGTFSPAQKGPVTQWGQHIGLIQFGEPQQRKFGAHAGQTFDEQMGAVVRYLQANGFKRGMGLLDLYSTINAGRPGLYDASDAHNGGTAGTVRDKVNDQMSPHRRRAAAMFGEAYADNSAPMQDGGPALSSSADLPVLQSGEARVAALIPDDTNGLEGLAPESLITNPLDPLSTPEVKLEQIHRLTSENKPIVDSFLGEIDSELGTTSKSSIKEDAAILSKASRPSIIKENPWHDVEHVRDTFRFKTVINSVDDLPKIAEKLAAKGWEILKIDTAKMLRPKAWGWRFVALDLRMPNGKLVEYYMPLKELEAAKKGGNHKLFEKWRNENIDELSPDRLAEYLIDLETSSAAYDAAFNAALERTQTDVNAVRAALDNFEAASTGTVLNSASSAPVRGNGALGDHSPSSTRTPTNPSNPRTTDTLPLSETSTLSGLTGISGSSDPSAPNAANSAEPILPRAGLDNAQDGMAADLSMAVNRSAAWASSLFDQLDAAPRSEARRIAYGVQIDRKAGGTYHLTDRRDVSTLPDDAPFLGRDGETMSRPEAEAFMQDVAERANQRWSDAIGDRPETPMDALARLTEENPDRPVLDQYDQNGDGVYRTISDSLAEIEAERIKAELDSKAYNAAINCSLRRGGDEG